MWPQKRVCLWNPTSRARGTIIVRLRQKMAMARHPPRGHGFHLDKAHLRLFPRVKPVVAGGGGWKWMVCLILIGLFMFWGCSNPPKQLDRSVSRPQVVVTPETIRLGVAKLMDTKIVFEGSGFKPGDSMFITLIGPNETKAIVAEGPINPDGTFRVEVGDSSAAKLTKAMEILRADIAFNEKFESVIVISRPPIPQGVYTVKVTSMLSDLTAETKLNVKGPSVIDRLKDWIGSLMGKIEYKKGER